MKHCIAIAVIGNRLEQWKSYHLHDTLCHLNCSMCAEKCNSKVVRRYVYMRIQLIQCQRAECFQVAPFSHAFIHLQHT